MNRNPTTWMKEDRRYMKIATVNCAGLKPHYEDIKSDSRLLKADIILLQETSLNNEIDTDFEISSHHVHLHIRQGNGKGLSFYFYLNRDYDDECHIVEESFQICKIRLKNFDIFNVYRSSNGSKEALCSRLEDLLVGTQKTIICGDFNICNKSEKNNSVSRLLQGYGFKQIVKEATHIRGRSIDHIYLKDCVQFLDLERYSPYFTDHDAHLLTVDQD